MLALLSIALFALAGFYALATLAHGWTRYGKLALAAKGEFERCPEHRELRYRVIELKPSNVVTLPLRPRLALPAEPLRAAA